MIGLSLSTLVLVAAVRAPVTPITLAVVAPPDVTDTLVHQVCAEAEAIWEPAGIVFACDPHASKDTETRWTIEVTIDDRPTPVGRERALGWVVFNSEGAESSLHLSRASAEALLQGTPTIKVPTIFSHEILIGRALGRALAHELGHYIFESKLHTPRGLMRADWDADETFALSRKGFELSSQQRVTAAGCLSMELAAAHSASRVSSW